MNKEQTAIERDALEWWSKLTANEAQIIITKHNFVDTVINDIYKIELYKLEHPAAPTVEDKEDNSKLNYEGNVQCWGQGYAKLEFYATNVYEAKAHVQHLVNMKDGNELSLEWDLPPTQIYYISYRKKGNKNWIYVYTTLPFDAEMNKGIKMADYAAKLKADNKLLREALQNREGSFYMDICRAYNAGKENAFAMVAENKKMGETSTTFKASHDYFIEEFPGFKTNVP